MKNYPYPDHCLWIKAGQRKLFDPGGCMCPRDTSLVPIGTAQPKKKILILLQVIERVFQSEKQKSVTWLFCSFLQVSRWNHGSLFRKLFWWTLERRSGRPGTVTNLKYLLLKEIYLLFCYFSDLICYVVILIFSVIFIMTFFIIVNADLSVSWLPLQLWTSTQTN